MSVFTVCMYIYTVLYINSQKIELICFMVLKKYLLLTMAGFIWSQYTVK